VRAAVRILAGRWKGRRLEGGPAARPTSSRARAALFSILGGRVAGARVLDLYAGTGAVGFEAVSRGAAFAALVDTEGEPLRQSAARIGASPGEIEIVETSADEALDRLGRRGERFGVVFADPPYGDAPDLRPAAAVLAPSGLLVLQRDTGGEAPDVPGLTLLERRPYGRNVFFFFGMR